VKVVQVTPVVAFGDAIGNEIVALKDMLSKAGYKTEIYYSDGVDHRLPKNIAKHISKMKLAEDDVIIYHLATGTELNFKIDQYTGKKIIRYHNITPAYFFKGYNATSQSICEEGYRGAKYLADKADYILADSTYNKNDLIKMGYTCPGEVIPILLALDDYKKQPNQSVLERYGKDGFKNFLFTGRVVPNKKPEDVIAAFYCYHKFINEKSRLFLVGNYVGMERYYNRLKSYIKELELESYVIFPGHIKFDEVLAYYALADAFVCMSEHEGFCVPLVEAMYFNIPIIAYNSSAVGETLGGCGILLEDKNPKIVAEWMHRVVTDESLKEVLIGQGQERLNFFSHENVENMFLKCIHDFVETKK